MSNNEKSQREDSQYDAPIPPVIVINSKNCMMSDKWLRLLFMVLFVICHYIVRVIIYLLAIVQFILVLFTNKPNENLLKFGQNLSYYAYQILRFLSYNTEEKPFPFTPWPNDKI